MRRKTLLIAILLCFSLLLLQNCATSTLQTAKTTPKGHVDMFFGGTYLTEGAFTPEIGFKFGVSDRMDIGLRLFSLGFMGEIKIGVIQSKGPGLNLALVGGAGYSTFNFYSYEVGAIISIDTEKIAPYASAKIRRFGFASGEEDSDFLNDITGEFMILAGGICLFPQSTFSIFAELNWFQSVKLFGQSATGTSQAILSGGFRIRI